MNYKKSKLRCAIIGAGFWSTYQIHAWKELSDVQVVAICDKDRNKAVNVGEHFNIPGIYSDMKELVYKEDVDFVDIITDVNSHEYLCKIAFSKGIHVICQKPMTNDLSSAKELVEKAKDENVKFFVHENFRWQSPIRKIKSLIEDDSIGRIFKARVSFCSNFPVFENQPFLAQLDEFIISDIGSHILDICRFLLGEVQSLSCHTQKINKNIKGEDVANVVMHMKNGAFCLAEMSYASILEKNSFPHTYIYLEGDKGSIRLEHDYEIQLTTKYKTTRYVEKPKYYGWIDPSYALVHSSIVDCNINILNDIKGLSPAETSGHDNLKTVHLVRAAYFSARTEQKVNMDNFSCHS